MTLPLDETREEAHTRLMTSTEQAIRANERKKMNARSQRQWEASRRRDTLDAHGTMSDDCGCKVCAS